MPKTVFSIDYGEGYELATPQTSDFRKYRKTALTEAQQINHPFSVLTLEGRLYGKAGDYLMRGVEGELYPCAKSVFETSYESADGKTTRS